MTNRWTWVALGAALVALGLSGCKQKAAQPAAAPAGASASESVVAKFAGGSVTTAELEKEMKPVRVQLDRKRWMAEQQERTNALKQLVAKKLMAAEATKRGTNEEGLMRDLASKVPPPSETELKSFYEANKGQMGGAPYEAMRPRIGQYLMSQRFQQAQGQLLDQLASQANIQITLAPEPGPRVENAAVGPSKGPQNAPVTVIAFSDFQCPYCAKAREAVDQVVKAYGDKVRVVFRDYPLPMHPMAAKAAEAGQCAAAQGKFWELHDYLFAHQDKLAPADLKAAARQVGLDGGKFDGCLDGGQMAKTVEESVAAGKDAVVEGTPSFFVNGQLMPGPATFDSFKLMIDAELKRLGR